MISFSEMLKGKQHKLDKNKNGKLDSHDFKLLRKEEQELEEAVGKVETKKYSWGTMKTVHHGSEFSVPMHPEHHKAIAKLKDNQEHKFRDETGRDWTAKRMGDKVHIHGANDGGKTVVKHSDLKEELDEKFINGREYASQGVMHPDHAKMDIHKVTGQSVDFYASKTGNKMHGVVKKNDGKEVHIQAHKGIGDGKLHKFKVTPNLPKPVSEGLDEATPNKQQVKQAIGIARDKRYAGGNMTGAVKAMDKLNKGLAQHPAVKKELQKQNENIEFSMTAEEFEQLDEISKKTLGSYINKAAVDLTHRVGDAERKKTLAGADYAHSISRGISAKTADAHMKKDYEKAKPDVKKAAQRMRGIEKAVGRLTKEEVEDIDEGMKQNLRKYVPGYAKRELDKKMDAQAYAPGDSTKKTVDKDVNYGRYKKIADKLKKEEVEELEELSKSTLASYAKSATVDARMSQRTAKDFERHELKSRKPEYKAGAKELKDKYQQRAWKRQAGVHKAIDRLAKEEVELDEKMDMSKADMGDVIKDFQKSDAPQFAGKSKEKRRQMAIAAKLQADRMKKEGVEMKSYRQFMEELYDKLPEETELEEAEKATGDLKDACWKGYTAVGMKMKNGKKVPNCVPVKEDVVEEEVEQIDELDMNLLKSMQKHAKANPKPKSSSDDAIDPKTGRLKPYGYRGKSEYEKSETGDDDEPKKRGRKAGITIGTYKRRQPK